MPNPFRRYACAHAGTRIPALPFCLLLCLLSLTAPRAIGQETVPATPLMKQLNRLDLFFGAAGIINNSVSGTEQRDRTGLTIKPSNTVGELLTIRYIARPWVGFEYNFGNARFVQNYTFAAPTKNVLPGGAQAGVHEETLGYVAHPPHPFFGVQPFLGAGGGTMRFTPTPYGGQGLPFQYRAVYYYNVGVENTFPSSHFGVRLGFRQLIYLDPDFQQNYLTITRRGHTSEPYFGFYARF
jgi:hypothetical protein